MSNYYRNITDVISIEGIEVDAGSLWILSPAKSALNPEKQLLVLDDEDQYVCALLTEDFEEVK